MKLEITIIDDSLRDALALEKLLASSASKLPCGIETVKYTDPASALAAAGSKSAAQRMVFADVMMPGLSGTELIPLMREKCGADVLFVLTSSQHGFMKDGYSIEAFDFICKPFSEEDILSVLRRAEARFRESAKGAFEFYADKTDYKIDYSDIVTITVTKNYAALITPEARYCFRATVKQLLEKLPEQFVRVSGNTIVNINRVTSISPKLVTLRKDGLTVEVKKTYFPHLMEAFRKFN